MLDTNICSLIMREQPEAVLKRLEQAVLRNHRTVISAITYQEMRSGATGPKASPRHIALVDAFCARLDAILPWIARRSTLPRTSGWRCAWQARRSARMTRPLPGMRLPPAPSW
jgi:tRNA(fMet)-specific endonuclease VapC